jgi:heme-degrading monooxygenase HmoA
MTLEITAFLIQPGQKHGFETAFAKAQRLLVSMRGYLSHDLQHSVESDQIYVLLIEWRALEDATLGFRKSNEYERWMALIQGFLLEAPHVQHFRAVR